ncbi:MAG TPA: hypothetical protein ACFCUD_13160 [Cyclobacteriaceae bacterium]
MDNSGELTYEMATDFNGSVTFDVQVQDDGGTANGGDDISSAVTVTINITDVPPTFSAFSVSADDDIITVDGNLDEFGTVYILVVNDDVITSPTGAQIKSNVMNLPTANLFGDSVNLASVTNFSIDIPTNSLDTFDIYAVAQDNSGNMFSIIQQTLNVQTGGVTISAPSLTSVCPDGDFNTLGDIIISERIANDFDMGTGQSLILGLTNGFEFDTGSSPTINTTDADVSMPTSTFTSNTTLRVEYDVMGQSDIGNLRISGLEIIGNGNTGTVNAQLERLGGTADIYLNDVGTVHATLESDFPNLSFTTGSGQTEFANTVTSDTLIGNQSVGAGDSISFSGIGVANNRFFPGLVGNGTYTVTYTFIDASGCQASVSQDLVVSDGGSIDNVDAEECADQILTLNTVSGVTGEPGINLFKIVHLVGTDTSNVVSGGTPGTQTMDGSGFEFNTSIALDSVGDGNSITLSVIAINESDGSIFEESTQDVVINALPDSTFSTFDGNTTYCVDDNGGLVPLTANFTGTGANFTASVGTINMSGELDLASVLGSSTVPVTTSITYNTGSDGAGCESASSVDITVNPQNTLGLTFSIASDSVCYTDASFTITADSIPMGGSTGTYSFVGANTGVFQNDGDDGVVDFAPQLSMQSAGFNNEFNDDANFTIRYTFTNIYGCTSSIDTTITVVPNPQISINFPEGDEFCFDVATDSIIDIEGVIDNPGALGVSSGSFAYSSLAGLSGSGADRQLDLNQLVTDSSQSQFTSRSYPIEITYTTDLGCVNSVQETITINAMPQVSITDAGSQAFSSTNDTLAFCVSEGTILVEAIPGGTGGTFSITNDPGGIDSNVGLEGALTNVSDVDLDLIDAHLAVESDTIGGDSTFHEITYTFTNSDGCTRDSTYVIRIDPLPDIDFDLPTDICYSDASINLQGQESGINVSGTFTITSPTTSGDITIVSDIINPSNRADASGATNAFDAYDDGTSIDFTSEHTVEFTFTDVNGCENSISKNIVIHQEPNPVINGILTQYCKGGGSSNITTDLINAGGTFQSPSDRFFTILPQTVGLDSTGFTDNGDGTATIDPDFMDVGFYDVTFTYEITNNTTVCSGSVTETIEITDAVDATITGAIEDNYCENEAFEIVLTGTPSPAVTTDVFTLSQVSTVDSTVISNIETFDFGETFSNASADLDIGFYRISYTFDDGAACTGVADTFFTVIPTPQPELNIVRDGAVIPGVFVPSASEVCIDDVSTPSANNSNKISIVNNTDASSFGDIASGKFSAIIDPSGINLTVNTAANGIENIDSETAFFYPRNAVNTALLSNPDLANANFVEIQINYEYTNTTGCVGLASDFGNTETILVYNLPEPTLELSTIGIDNTSADGEYCIEQEPVTVSVDDIDIDPDNFSGNGVFNINVPLLDGTAFIQNNDLSATFDPSEAYNIMSSNGLLTSDGIAEFEITYNYTTTLGCSSMDIDPITIEINPPPTVDFNIVEDLGGEDQTEFCNDDDGDNTIFLVGTVDGGSFTNPNGSNVPIGNTNDPRVSSLDLEQAYILEAGNDSPGSVLFSINYSFTDEITGCSGQTSRDITIKKPSPSSLSFIQGSIENCITDDNIIITADSIPTDSTSGSFNIVDDDGLSAMDGISDNGNGILTINPSEAGDEQDVEELIVTYSFTDADGCVSISEELQININPQPLVSAMSNEAEVCVDGNDLIITGAGNLAVSDGEFFIETNADSALTNQGDGTALFNPSIAHLALGASISGGNATSHEIFYVFTDEKGCSDTASTSVIVNPLPTPSLQLSEAGVGIGNNEFCIDGGIIDIEGFPRVTFNTSGSFDAPSIGNILLDNDDGSAEIDLMDAFTAIDPTNTVPQVEFEVTYKFTDENTCTSTTDALTIIINNTPFPSFDVVRDSISLVNDSRVVLCRDDVSLDGAGSNDLINLVNTSNATAGNLIAGDFSIAGIDGFSLSSGALSAINERSIDKKSQDTAYFYPSEAVDAAIQNSDALISQEFIDFRINYRFTNDLGCNGETLNQNIPEFDSTIVVRVYQLPEPVITFNEPGPTPEQNEFCRDNDLVNLSVTEIEFNSLGGSGFYRSTNSDLTLPDSVLNNTGQTNALFDPGAAYNFALDQGLIASNNAQASFDILFDYETNIGCRNTSNTITLKVNPFPKPEIMLSQQGVGIDGNQFCIDDGNIEIEGSPLVTGSTEGRFVAPEIGGALDDSDNGRAKINLFQAFTAIDSSRTADKVEFEVFYEFTDEKTCQSVTDALTVIINNTPFPSFDVIRDSVSLVNNRRVVLCEDDPSLEGAMDLDLVKLVNTSNTVAGNLIFGDFEISGIGGFPLSDGALSAINERGIEKISEDTSFFYPSEAVQAAIENARVFFENRANLDFKINYTFTNDLGCTGEAENEAIVTFDSTIIINVFQLPEPEIEFEAFGPVSNLEVCRDNGLVEVIVDNIMFNPNGGDGSFSYLNEDSVLIDLPDSVLSNITPSSALFNPAAGFNYALNTGLINLKTEQAFFDIVYDFTSADGCRNLSNIITLRINPFPEPEISLAFNGGGNGLNEFCIDAEDIVLNGSPIPSVNNDGRFIAPEITGALSDDDQGRATINLREAFFAIDPTQQLRDVAFDISYEFTDNNGCTFESEPQTIIINNDPFPTFDIQRDSISIIFNDTLVTCEEDPSQAENDFTEDRILLINNSPDEMGEFIEGEFRVIGVGNNDDDDVPLLVRNAIDTISKDSAYFYPRAAIQDVNNNFPVFNSSTFLDFTIDYVITDENGCDGNTKVNGVGVDNITVDNSKVIRVFRVPEPEIIIAEGFGGNTISREGVEFDEAYCEDFPDDVIIEVDTIRFDAGGEGDFIVTGFGVLTNENTNTSTIINSIDLSDFFNEEFRSMTFSPKEAYDEMVNQGIIERADDPEDDVIDALFEIRYSYEQNIGLSCDSTSAPVTLLVTPKPVTSMTLEWMPVEDNELFDRSETVRVNDPGLDTIDLTPRRVRSLAESGQQRDLDANIVELSIASHKDPVTPIIETFSVDSSIADALFFEPAINDMVFDPLLATQENPLIINEQILRYDLEDADECKQEDSVLLRIFPQPVADFEIEGGCVSDLNDSIPIEPINLIDLTPRFTPNSTPDDRLNFWAWNVRYLGGNSQIDGGTVGVPEDISTTNSQTRDTTILITEPGIYEVSLQVRSNRGGWSNIERDTLVVGFTPEPTILWSENITAGQEMTFTGASLNGQFINSNDEELQEFIGDPIITTTWTVDGIFVRSEQISNARDTLNFTFDAPGQHIISLRMSTNNGCSDTSIDTINILPKISVFPDQPYFENFENEDNGWEIEENIIVPNDPELDNQFAADFKFQPRTNSWNIQSIDSLSQNAWITNGDTLDSYTPNEDSWVYSPAFDISSLERPMIDFDLLYEFSDGDGVIIQYSTDSGKVWKRLGTNDGIDNTGINWYNETFVRGSPGGDDQIIDDDLGAQEIGWAGIQSEIKETRHKLDIIPSDERRHVRFRFALGSDGAADDNFGLAFSNFEIKERERIVLIEQFSSTLLASSNTANNVIEFRLNQPLINNNDAFSINYFTDLGNDATARTSDPINELNNADPAARSAFYGVDAIPSSFLNGDVDFSDGLQNVNWTENDLNREALRDAEFEIELTLDDDVSSTISGNATFTSGINLPEDLSLLRFFFVVTENRIEFEGETYFDVLRRILPDGAGIVFEESAVSVGDQFTYDFSWDLFQLQEDNPLNINPDNLRVIAFVQNNATKEVYQVATTSVAEKQLPVVTDIGDELVDDALDYDIIPNPSDKAVEIQFTERISNDKDYIIYDQSGKEVFRGNVSIGTKGFIIDTRDYPSGVFLIRFPDTTNELPMKRMLILHK